MVSDTMMMTGGEGTDRRVSADLKTWALIIVLACGCGGRDRDADLSGPWTGTLASSSMTVDILVVFDGRSSGSISGRLTIPALGIEDQQLSGVELEGVHVAFGIPEVPGDARFSGDLVEGGDAMRGSFSQAGQAFTFALARGMPADFDFGKYRPGSETELAGRIARDLIDGYLDEAKGSDLAERLSAAVASNELESASTGAELASDWTDWIQRQSGDLHLRLLYHMEEALEKQPAAEPSAPEAATGTNDFGFVKAEMLSDSVGYLDLRQFSDAPEAQAMADAAMERLAAADALIIDLGRNQGGSPLMVQYLSSYFFGEPTHLVDTKIRGEPEPRERWTLAEVGGRQRPNLPLFVLTSSDTISAAESFVFGLRSRGRITVIGETTAGGGHFSELDYLGDGFTLVLPIGRTYDPRTGEGWEATGIEPDIEVPYSQALTTAIERIEDQS